MDLKGMTTKTGGVISIHKYKDCATKAYTTNLFGGKWLIIKEPKVVDLIDELIVNRFNDEIYNKLLSELGAMSEEIMSTSEPYRRERGAGGGSSCESSESSETYKSYDETTGEVTFDQTKLKNDVCNNILKFFSEFTFSPSARFVNTLLNYSKISNAKANEYIKDYLALSDSPDKNNIVEKCKSGEWTDILSNLRQVECDKSINTRLKIYYGPQGTGKTTRAMQEAPEAAVIVCNSSMLPDDLMQDFDFNDETGKPVFKKSALRVSMEEGKTIILDEINLLPYETLRFFQGLTDGKPIITYKGDNIEIKESFNIIGTMNLMINGQVFNLPDPLVDRCYDIVEMKPNSKELAGMSF